MLAKKRRESGPSEQTVRREFRRLLRDHPRETDPSELVSLWVASRPRILSRVQDADRADALDGLATMFREEAEKMGRKMD